MVKVIQPLLLGKILWYIENYDPEDKRSLHMAYGYAAAMSLSVFGMAVLQHLYYYCVQRIGMRLRVAICHMIYKKVSVFLSKRLEKCAQQMSVIFSSGSWSQQSSHGTNNHRANCEPPLE